MQIATPTIPPSLSPLTAYPPSEALKAWAETAPLQTIPDMFRASVEAHPDANFLGAKVDGSWKYLTYRQTQEKALAVASALLDLGMKPGDRVAVIANNSPEWALTDLGTQQAAGVLTPLFPSLAPGAAGHDLAVGREADLHALQGRPDGAQDGPAHPVDGQHGAGLGQPVALHHGRPRADEEAAHVRPQGRAAGEEEAHAAAGLGAHLRQHQPVGQPVLRAVVPGDAALLPLRFVALAGPQTPLEHGLLPARPRGHRRLHPVMDGLVDARDAGDDGGVDLLQVLPQLLDALGVGDGASGSHHPVVHAALQHV